MAACPSCRASFAGWPKSCPRCGTTLDLLVPDLDISPRSAAPPSRVVAPALPSTVEGTGALVGKTDREERQLLEANDEEPGFELELDIGPRHGTAAQRASEPGTAPMSTTARPTSRTTSSAGIVRHPATQRAPLVPSTSRVSSGALRAPAPPSDDGDTEAAEVAALASHGPTPSRWFQTPWYALRVWLRRRELRGALAKLQGALHEAELRRDLRCRELGAALRPLLQAESRHSGWLAAVTEAERRHGEHAEAATHARAGQRARSEDFEAQLAAIDARVNEASSRLTVLEDTARQAEASHQKLEARRKRVDIEVRAARVQLETASTPAEERLAAEQVVATAQNEREARRLEEHAAHQRLEALRLMLGKERQVLAELERQRSEVRVGQGSVEREYARLIDRRSAAAGGASRRLDEALIELGLRAFSEPEQVAMALLPATLGASLRQGVAEASAQLQQLEREVARHEQALVHADPAALRQGVMWASVLTLVLFASVALWRLLRSNPYLPSGP